MTERKTYEGNLDAGGKRFALIVSRYNEFFVSRLLSGAEDCLIRHGASPEDVEVFRVPGCFELALVAKKVAQTGKFDTEVPVIFGVITTETVEQAVDRSGARAGNRGAESAMAAIEMANLLGGLSAP